MNGDGEGDEGVVRMEEEVKERLVFMWGYLPGALPQRSPLLSPLAVRLPPSSGAGCSWKDVCGGGCGFAMAISGGFKDSAFDLIFISKTLCFFVDWIWKLSSSLCCNIERAFLSRRVQIFCFW